MRRPKSKALGPKPPLTHSLTPLNLTLPAAPKFALRVRFVSYTFFDHTGDIGLRLAATTVDALFAEAARAFTAVLTDPDGVRPSLEQHVTLEAPALDLLLADWLGELLHLFDARGLLVHHADATVSQSPKECRLEAVLFGEPLDSGRHPINVLVKGVTYHQLAVDFVDNQWRASVIFDI